MARAVPRGKSQTNRHDKMSAEILAQGFLLNRPYDTDKRKIVTTRPIRINICKDELERIRSNSLPRVITLISSTSADSAKTPPRKP
jgi:hypothetical protein